MKYMYQEVLKVHSRQIHDRQKGKQKLYLKKNFLSFKSTKDVLWVRTLYSDF